MKCALVTFTRNNAAEIERKLYERVPAIPRSIERATWFSFLLREVVRPYRPVLYDQRIDGLCWVNGTSAPFSNERDIGQHYFANARLIYSDKIAKFACVCERESGGAVLRRLAQRFDHIYIDEIQDMAGYDLDLLERMLRAGIQLTMIGDHRQATYSTHNSRRNASYARSDIAKKFREWKKAGLVTISYERQTHRCHQAIATLADTMYPDEPPTESLNTRETGHDGVFVVKRAGVAQYLQTFHPQVLRLNRTTRCEVPSAMNFGESKGLTFDRVLIFPHGGATRWLKSGDLECIMGSLAKMYVGVTRARQSVAFVFDGECAIPTITRYE